MSDNPEKWMGKVINSWMRESKKKWRPQQLWDWLQGYDFPPVGHDEDPYLCLLRALGTMKDEKAARDEFAGLVRRAIEDQPDLDVAAPGKRPNQVLYNLFKLCGGLSRPDQLGDVLLGFLRRRRLSGEWRGLDLRAALRGALIANQKDTELVKVWIAMVKGRKDEFLPGGPFDGFAGLVKMPLKTTPGQPSDEAIAIGLREMTDVLKDDSDRRFRFQSLLRQVVAIHSNRATWWRDFIAMADDGRWPTWAVRCLPVAILPVEGESDETWFLWKFLADCFVHPLGDGLMVLKDYCLGEFVEVKLIPQATRRVLKIAEEVEQQLREGHEPTDRVIRAIAGSALDEAEQIAEYETSGDVQVYFAARSSLLEETVIRVD